jgi:PAS domain S-box-containing protein
LQDIRVLAAEGIVVQQEKREFPFLLSTRLYPEWPIAKLIKTPNELATKIAVALMSMGRYDPASVAAESGGWTYPMNYQIVHDLMMELKIGYYGKLRQLTLTEVLKKYWMEALSALLVFLITSGALLLVLRLNRRLATIKKELDIELAARKKVLAEIQRSEEQHRLLIKMLPLAVFVHAQGKIVYVNPAFLTLFKASSPDEVIGMRLIEFTPPELFDTIEERRRIMTEERCTLPPLELNIRCMDGTVITVVSTPIPIIFQEQPAILTALYDITERKHGEVELQKAHKLLHIQLIEIEDLHARLNAKNSL